MLYVYNLYIYKSITNAYHIRLWIGIYSRTGYWVQFISQVWPSTLEVVKLRLGIVTYNFLRPKGMAHQFQMCFLCLLERRPLWCSAFPHVADWRQLYHDAMVSNRHHSPWLLDGYWTAKWNIKSIYRIRMDKGAVGWPQHCPKATSSVWLKRFDNLTPMLGGWSHPS